MASPSPYFAANGQRRVGFQGAEVIEYDAELPSVVRLAGAGCVSPSKDSAKVALECRARGLQEEDPEKTLRLQYVAELQSVLHERGFQPISNDLRELQTQHRVAELLLTWAAGVDAPEAQDKENKHVTIDVLNPNTLQRAQLAKKQLQGLVDDGYAFGRRFLDVETFVASLERAELLQLAQKRAMKLPKLDTKERAKVKALDRELFGQYGEAEGKPLKSLTLRQLVAEAEARGLLAEDKRDSKGKKSKRGWVDMLRPVIRAEVRAEKIREKEEGLLREQLVMELEKEMQQEQQSKMKEFAEMILQQTQQCDCKEPENDPTLSQETQQDTGNEAHTAGRYLEALAKSLSTPKETSSQATEGMAMTE